jgi:hypothetical protein
LLTKTQLKLMKTLQTTIRHVACIAFLLVISYNALLAQETATTTTTTTEETKEEEPKFTLSGSIDTYFHLSNREEWAPGTSFANMKGFGLGMANLIASYGGDKAGFTADLAFGPRGYDAVFGPSYTGQRIINQMFAYYKFNKAVTLNLGQFNTFVGMETITPVPNTHYSTSYLFTNGPFNHTGARLDIAAESGFVAKLAIMNPTDIVELNPVDTYTLGAQLGYTKDSGGAWLNLLYGDPDGNEDTDPDNVYGSLFQIDLTSGWNLGETFYLGLNTSMRSLPFEDSADGDASSFFGVALYPKLTLSESFALGLRAEHFQIKNYYPAAGIGYDADGKGSVNAFTLSGNYTSGNLRFIPEIRFDSMAEDTFTTKGDTPEASKSMLTFNLAAVYKF